MKNTIQHSRWKPLICSMLSFLASFTAGMFLSSPLGDAADGFGIFVKLGTVFGLLGAIYGAIYALDIRFESAKSDRPILRTLICAGLGGLLVLSFQVHPPGTTNVTPVALGAGISGILGWFGWRWARHVDF